MKRILFALALGLLAATHAQAEFGVQEVLHRTGAKINHQHEAAFETSSVLRKIVDGYEAYDAIIGANYFWQVANEKKGIQAELARCVFMPFAHASSNESANHRSDSSIRLSKRYASYLLKIADNFHFFVIEGSNILSPLYITAPCAFVVKQNDRFLVMQAAAN